MQGTRRLGAWIATAGVALAMGIAPGNAPVAAAADQTDTAKKHFEKGVTLFNNDDFEGAFVEFKSAYEAKPHFAVRYNLGICLFKLHRYEEAASEMNAYIAEGGSSLPADKKKEIEDYLVELESLVGYVDFEGGVEGAKVLVDGKQRLVLPQDEPLALDVGEYTVEIVAEGYEKWEQTLTLPGGAKKTVKVTLVSTTKPAGEPAGKPIEGPVVEPPVEKHVFGDAGLAKAAAGEKDDGKARKKIGKGLFWSGLALTLLSGAIATTTSAVGLAHEKQYAKLDYDDDWKPLQADIEREELMSNIMWPLTGAFAIATLITAFFTDFAKSEGPAREGTPAKAASIWLWPDPRAPAIGFGLEM